MERNRTHNQSSSSSSPMFTLKMKVTPFLLNILFLLILLLMAPETECNSHSPSLAKEFVSNNGLAILPNILTLQEAQEIKTSIASLSKTMRKETGSIAIGRVGCHVPQESKIIEYLLSSKVVSRIARITGKGQSLRAAEFPLEVRQYTIGSSMPLHKDEVLYKTPQIEFIYTVENSSDSVLQYIDRSGKMMTEWTQPNTLVVIQADAVLHAVTPTTRGSRTIIKGLLTTTDGKTEAYERAMRTYKSGRR